MSTPAPFFAPVTASEGAPVQLALQRLWLAGNILPIGARLTVQHLFRSAEEKPLEVIYAFPLPRDATLRSFRISGKGFEVTSELKSTADAVDLYERALDQGSLAALLRQHRDGLMNLTVGNIRPGETVVVYLEILAGLELRDDGFRFRFPFTLAPSYHPRAKAAVLEPGVGEIELPAGEFGDVILPPFHRDASALHQIGFDLSISSRLEIDELASPSHAVRVKRDTPQTNIVALAPEKDIPNRDLVLDARFKAPAPQVLAGAMPEGKGQFAAIIPSSSFGASAETPRRVVFLLDRSGSMQGTPLVQATRAVEACLGVLSDNDLFGLVAFDDHVESFQSRLVPGTRRNRDRAHDYLKGITSGGGTELAQGVDAAAKLLTGRPGDLFILTDGQVFGTEQILDHARSAGTRLHCLGIGSASQDRFLTLLARETGGVSRFVTPSERVDMSAVDLFASIGRPVASALKAGGEVQPPPPASVFSGTPVLLFGETSSSASRSLDLTWDSGRLTLPVAFDNDDVAETIRLLQGSRLITDEESRSGNRLLELSRAYGLASREMALVAVVKREGDQPGELPETRVVPVGMPQDTGFDTYFARQLPFKCHRLVSRADRASGVFARPAFLRESTADALAAPASTALPQAPEDSLIELASRMESDGGMPGRDSETRAGVTIATLFAFLEHGHTSRKGAFRSHVKRLVAFLASLTALRPGRQFFVTAALDLARDGHAPAGDWLPVALDPADPWKHLESALTAR